MASTENDFFHNVGRRVREVTQQSIQRGKEFLGGLRGSATPEPAAVETPKRELHGAARSASHGQEFTKGMSNQVFQEVPGDARTWRGATNAAVDADLGLRQPPRPPAPPAWGSRNPNVPDGPNLSPQARQYIEGNVAQDARFAQARAGAPTPPTPQVPQAPKPSGGFLRGAARLAAPLAAAAGVPDQLERGATDMDDQIAQEMGATGNATRAVAGNTLSLVRRTGNALTSIPFTDIGLRGGDRLIGGIRDVAQGNLLGTTQFEESPASAASAASAAARQPGQPPATRPQPGAGTGATRPQPGDDGLIPTMARPGSAGNGLRVSAEELMSGRAVPKPGYGAFRVSGGQGSGVATGLGDGTVDSPAAGMPAAGMRGPAYFPGNTIGEQMGNMVAANTRLAAALNEQNQGNKNADRLVTAQGNAATHAASMARVRLDTAKLNDEQGKARRANFQNRIKAEAEAAEPTSTPGALYGSNAVDPKAREANVKRREAQLLADFEYSVGDAKDPQTGRRLRIEDLSETAQNQLFDAQKYKERVSASRQTWGSFFRDFFGNKRFDSKNVYSYLPVGVERSKMGGGYIVQFANGNTASVEDVSGGTWRAFKPNDPVDADMLARVAKLIQQHKEQEAKGAR